MLPLIVVETGHPAVEHARGQLTALGWAVSTSALPGNVHELTVHDDRTAGAAVWSAVDGCGLLVEASAGREVIDRLCDDLRRLGQLDHRITDDGVLTEDQHAILVLLSVGATLGSAASELHLSRRSADRRLADARRRLGAPSTAAALVAWRRALATLPRPPHSASTRNHPSV